MDHSETASLPDYTMFIRRLKMRSPALIMLVALSIAPLYLLAQGVDTTPPQLVSFTFSPLSIDVSSGPAAVTTTLNVTDNLAGVSFVRVDFRSPSSGQFQFLFPSRTAGTNLNGTYAGTLNFPQFGENGIWTVGGAALFDNAGNFSFVSTATLQAMGFPTQLTVTSTPADIQGPTVAGISITPSMVNVSSGPQTITIDLDLRDNLSGVVFSPGPTGSFFPFFPVQLRSPSGRQMRFTASSQTNSTGGTPLNGTWRATLTMPQFSEPGVWQIDFLQLRDVASNFSFLNTTQLQALGVQTDLIVSSSPSDTSPPALTGFSFLPTLIDTSASSQSVTVRLNITDNLAGADFSPTTQFLSFFENGVSFRSPSGQQFARAAFFTPFNLIAGTRQNGTWEASAFFSRFSEDGTWRVDQLVIKDAVRNMVTLDTGTLRAMGFPTDLVVIRPSLIGDGTITDPAAGGTVTDDTFGSRAQVTFPPGVLSNPTSVAIDVFQEPLDIPTPAGFQGPGTRFVNINLDPVPMFPLRAPGLTLVLPLVNPMIPGDRIDLFRVDPATGNLVPAIGVDGKPVVGTVNPDGLSATFVGVARLSVVVGLVPDIITVGINIRPGGVPNPINLGSKGTLPVAILSSATFDARNVDPTTVKLADAPVKIQPNGAPMAAFEDVNGDGLLDLVVHVAVPDLKLASTDTEAILAGKLFDRRRIRGVDSIQLVP